jgi:predicted transglutaminase-like cysteine proteinase
MPLNNSLMHLYNKQDWSLLKFTCNFDIIGTNQNIECTLRLFFNLFIVFILLQKDIVALGLFIISDDVLKKVETRYGSDALKRVTEMSQLINTLQDSPIEVQLKRVNDFFNRVAFVSDQENWQQEDYWSKPLEFLGVNKGDCEDYVIAKFFTLLKLGVPSDRLYFTYVTYLKTNQAHMVLTYVKTPDSIPLVLDNINKEILFASKRHDLRHVYSFNAQALYLNKQKSLGQIVPSGLKKNRRWVTFLSHVSMEQL